MVEASILIPAYNVEKYILESLKSVRRQENFDLARLETVIVNDGSSDCTGEVVGDYIKGNYDLNIKYWKSEFNEGVSSSRNKAAELARGDIFFYVDGDDVLHERCVADCMKVFKKRPDVDFIYTDHAAIDSSGEWVLYEKRKPDFDPDLLIRERYNWIGHVKAVRSMSNIPFDSGFKHAEDTDWILRLIDKGVKFYHIPKVRYFWRRGIDSISSRVDSGLAERYHNLAIDNSIERRRGFLNGE